MINYIHKDATDLAYGASKKRARNEIQIVVDAVLNDYLDELTREFKRAAQNGESVELVEPDREGLRLELAKHALANLTPEQRKALLTETYMAALESA